MRAAFSLAWATLLLAGSLACSSTPESNPPPAPSAEPAPARPRPALGSLAAGEPESPLAVEADDIALGQAGATVTIVAFLDFECGFCAQGFQTLDQLSQRYPRSELRIVIKHLPLDFHPQALPAAVAAQAVTLSAGPERGFEYARQLFQHRSELEFGLYAELLDTVGADRAQYNELVGDGETVRRVASDVVLARRHGVDGTPAFFVNGRLLSGAQPIEVFISAIDDEKQRMAAGGRPWAQAYAERVNENTRNSLAEAILARDPHDYRAPVDGSPVWGPADAPLTLIEFSDFECPYCKRAEATVQELKKVYAGQLRIVFKHKPLPFHKNARPAALLAALVQREKGDAEFWRVAAELFEASPALDRPTLLELGKRHGLSEELVNRALDGREASLLERLKKDEWLADDVDVEGTPHFFVNGKRLSGARPLVQFRALLDHELVRAKELLAAGTAPAALYDVLQREAVSPGAPERVEAIPSEKGQAVRGPANARYTIHVWSDFQCPYCRQAELVLRDLDRAHPGELRYVWHDLPLDFHDHALPAARAGREALAQKGSAGFWKMHDLLFALDGERVALEPSDLDGYARTVGLDPARFERGLAAGTHDPAIEADIAAATALGLRGTPAFVVAGYLVKGARPIEHFERILELARTTPAAPATSGSASGKAPAAAPGKPAAPAAPAATPKR
ncbi:MAG TPA: thioredoxin domain-containing protein [Polyangiaceae bacterium]|nr:thioredoxin domain-containing protein [Polyangiaceae bacterium]